MFNAARLTQARQRRGWTKVKLAAKVDLSPRRIAAFEKDEAVPPEATIGALASALRFPPEFFHRDELSLPAADQVSFRSLAKLTAGRRDAALAGAGLAYEVARWIDERFDLPKLGLPELGEVDPQTAASALRHEWGLGELPAPNLVHLLESRGVRVFSLVDDAGDLDALSTWNESVPFVFLTHHKSAERARWDAAHELGHLVLHHDRPQGRDREAEADEFARHFLLPSRGVLSDAPRYVDLTAVRRHKLVWKVSALAYIRQLHVLERLTDWQYRSLVIEASQAGYRSREDDIARERSKMLPMILEELANEGLTVPMIADDLAITPSELRGLLFLPVTPVDGDAPASAAPPDSTDRPALRLVT